MKFFLLIFFVLLQMSVASSQAIIQLQDTEKWHPIGKNSAYYKDNSGAGIQEILQPEFQSQFQIYNQDSPNFGSISDAVWIKFTVTNNTDKEFYLQIGSAFIDSIALYSMNGNQVGEIQVSGDNYQFDQRAIAVTTFLVPLNLVANSTRTYYLRAKTMQPFFFPLRVGTLPAFMEDTHILDFLQGIYLGFMLLIFLYNLFLYFSTKEKLYLYYVAYVASITWFMATVFQYVFEYMWPTFPIFNQYAVASSAATILTATIFTREFLHTEKLAPVIHKILLIFIAWAILDFILVFTPFKIAALMLAQAGIMIMAICFLIAGVTVFRKGYQPAKFYLIAWSFLIFGFVAAILETVNVLPVMYYLNSMQIGSAIEVMLLSFALADRINIYKKEREKAQAKALELAEEKSDLILVQNVLLEQKVNERTVALSKSLDDLKSTQTQLIQAEKMAGLGEITAGIAHEIQNPLNFVNNYSEVNVELIEDIDVELANGNVTEIKSLLNDLKENENKIFQHGKRAEAIVSSMILHSRINSGTRKLTDLNTLADEYLRLAYQSVRSKDESFESVCITNFDENLPQLEIVPADMGRALLNIINNAFQACAERSRSTGAERSRSIVNDKNGEGVEGYQPTVKITTRKLEDSVEISVEDNGNGIPDAFKDKIFQPFFTTRPTGQGTGLGLSLAYDMVNAQGGKLHVLSREGEGAKFVISLPI